MKVRSLSSRTAMTVLSSRATPEFVSMSARKSFATESGRCNGLMAHGGRVPACAPYLPVIRTATKVIISGEMRAASADQLMVEDWLGYLPQDCVEAMVIRNWHHTTR
jgi:hypothetical protein